jgi:hypothetical protein
MERRQLLEDLDLNGDAWATSPAYEDGESVGGIRSSSKRRGGRLSRGVATPLLGGRRYQARRRHREARQRERRRVRKPTVGWPVGGGLHSTTDGPLQNEGRAAAEMAHSPWWILVAG